MMRFLALSVAVILKWRVSCGAASFDRGVLGNLGKTDLIDTKVSRKHAMVTTISIGTPPQKLRCLLDSGSSDLWVPSERCQSCQGQNQNYFHADNSTTFLPELRDTGLGKKRPVEVRVSYGSGDIIGYKVQDTVAIGDMQVKNQSFIIVESAALPERHAWDGICGLGWNGLSKVGRPLYERLQETGHKPIITMVPTGDSSALMTVGDIPQNAIKESTLVWANAEEGITPGAAAATAGVLSGVQASSAAAKNRDFWIVQGGIAIRKPNATPVKFLVDTGTNQVLLVPPTYYRSFMNSLLPTDTFDKLCGTQPMAGNLVTCDCSIAKNTSMPPLRVYLGGRAFNLTIPELFTKVPSHDGGEDLCMLQVQPNGLSGSVIGGLIGGLLGGLLGGPGASHMNPAKSSLDGKGILDGLLGGILGDHVPNGTAHHDPFGGLLPSDGAPKGKLGGVMPNVSISAGGLSDSIDGLIKNMTSSVSAGSPQQSKQPVPDSQMGFPFPGSNPSGGMMPFSGDLSGKAVSAGTETKWSMDRKPDGSICKTTLHLVDGKVMKNTTTCTPPTQSRRLQALGGAPPPLLGGLGSDPMQDLWVLGGIFLERYVTIFDFEKARLGFAESATSIAHFDTNHLDDRLVSAANSYATVQDKSAGQSFAVVQNNRSSTSITAALSFFTLSCIAALVALKLTKFKSTETTGLVTSHTNLSPHDDDDDVEASACE